MSTGFEFEQGKLANLFFPRCKFIYCIASTHVLRRKHVNETRVCEYHVNILPCPEGKIAWYLTTMSKHTHPSKVNYHHVAIWYSMLSIGRLKYSHYSIFFFHRRNLQCAAATYTAERKDAHVIHLLIAMLILCRVKESDCSAKHIIYWMLLANVPIMILMYGF